MSKKKGNKQGKGDVVDVELLKIEEEYQKNIACVLFTPATTKHVCSPHSGSILGADGPVVPLTNEQKERIAKIFDSGEQLTHGEIRKLLCQSFGFTPYEELQDVIIKVFGKDYKDDQPLTESDFSSFLTQFQNPSYYYGQRLRRSAGRGLVKETLELIMRGCDPNTADGEGLNALHYAAEFNCVNIIREIAKLTAPIKGLLLLNARCKYGWTPLYCAAHHGNIDCVELLLKLGADPTVCNNVGKSPLHAAAAQDRTVICEVLLTHGVSTGSSSGNRKHSNSTANNAESLQMIQDKHKMTAMHEAAYKGHQQVYNMFVKLNNSDSSMRDVMNNVPQSYLHKIA